MDAKFINPFMQAATNALEVMAGIKCARGNPFLAEKFQSLADISGVIGFAGDAKGAVVLSFSETTAQIVFKRMTGETEDGDVSALSDTVGELANMVVGGAKPALSELGYNIQISIPSVVTGKNHTVLLGMSGPCLIVPFVIENQQFWVQITVKVN